MKKILVVVGGPTASGKTQLSIRLAQHFNTVIVSADSRQFYKELTVGTAKPSEEELAQVHHYFINSHPVAHHLNAGAYGEEARSLINTLFKNHSVIIMAGGSGLYIDAVLSGMDDLPPASPETRMYLNNLFEDSGIAALQQLLAQKDPAGFQIVDKDNPRRLIRALEICLATNAPFSELMGKKKINPDFDVICCGIDWPRPKLYERINERVQSMIENGLKEEAMELVPFKHLIPLKTVGYSEMFQHLEGKLTLDETTQLIAKNTRNYAKRQMTWFRKYPDMIWIEPNGSQLVIDKINELLAS